MKVLIKMDGQNALAIDAANTDIGSLLKAATGCEVVSKGWASDEPWKRKEGSTRVEIEIVDDSAFSAPTNAETTLKDQADKFRNYWLDENTEHEKTKAALKEAQDQLSDLKNRINGAA